MLRQGSTWAIVWRQFRSNRGALVGVVLVGMVAVIGLLAPLLAPYDPLEADLRNGLRPPTPAHPLGTDELGRDVLSRLMYGARISLQVGLISLSIAAGCGLALGLTAGYYRGLLDDVISRVVDVLLAFPDILLALLVVTILGPSLQNVMIAVGVAGIPTYARLSRGSTLGVREMEYIVGARAVGCYDRRIIWRYVLPNVLPPVIVMATLGVAGAILAAASLSFIGLGAQRPTPEWGAMLSSGRDFMRSAWWIAVFPGVSIMVTVIALNLIGDGLRDALDPKLRR